MKPKAAYGALIPQRVLLGHIRGVAFMYSFLKLLEIKLK